MGSEDYCKDCSDDYKSELSDLKANCTKCKAEYEGKLPKAIKIFEDEIIRLQKEREKDQEKFADLYIDNVGKTSRLDQLKQENKELKEKIGEHNSFINGNYLSDAWNDYQELLKESE